LTIVFELTEADMTKQKERLEKEVFENLYRDNTIGIRCPDSAIASGLLGLVNHPAVAPSANITGRAAAISAEEVLEQFGDGLELLLDGGTCKYKQNSTVAKIGKNGVEILRAGAYPKEKLEETAQVKFLLVCTGNTCRSPMAHGFFSKYLAEKSGCGVDRLEQKGYKVFSAGTMGLVGSQATSEAIAACRAKGIEIAEHRSTALSKELLDDCDIIYVMGRMHREYVVSMSPEAAEKCMLLADDVEIPDPIGQPQATYNSCAEMIEKAVKKRIGELEI
jgi:protein-tyrosine phosphatase